MVSFVMANGAGLISGVPNMKNDFTIYGIKNTTKKELYIYISGPGSCPFYFEDSMIKNSIKVIYIPKKPGNYKIHIKFGGINIKNSPFNVVIRGRTPFLTLEEKVKPYTYDYVFPLDTYNNVLTRSVASVIASGRGLNCGLSGIDNEIVIDVRSAAPGRLNCNITGPGNVDIRNFGLCDGIYKISYLPHQPGEYNVDIKYAERRIRNSPFRITVL